MRQLDSRHFRYGVPYPPALIAWEWTRNVSVEQRKRNLTQCAWSMLLGREFRMYLLCHANSLVVCKCLPIMYRYTDSRSDCLQPRYTFRIIADTFLWPIFNSCSRITRAQEPYILCIAEPHINDELRSILIWASPWLHSCASLMIHRLSILQFTQPRCSHPTGGIPKSQIMEPRLIESSKRTPL